MTLPPGQHAIKGFPRFGTHGHERPPAVPADPGIDVDGARVRVADLADMRRTEAVADFHCVAGWSATGLRWEGVRVLDLIDPPPEVTHLRFRGLDGHWSVAALEDLGDALVADRLDGAPLDARHGAPVRLVSPQQYGFVSTKHLCGIEYLTSAPLFGAGAATTPARVFLSLLGFRFYTRARVWEEERNRVVPARLLRLINPLFTASLDR